MLRPKRLFALLRQLAPIAVSLPLVAANTDDCSIAFRLVGDEGNAGIAAELADPDADTDRDGLTNGQELELPNVDDLPDEVMQDPVFFRTQGKQRGRDGCRIPLPWESGISPFGFGAAGSQPWLPMPEYWGDYSIAKQNAQSE